ncbi:MAG: hypothetical protein L6R36_003473 [Xanthoria steineri]|nr:MAG: hypothetical protein L6R36_003473 [Xanthoria steineri]
MSKTDDPSQDTANGTASRLQQANQAVEKFGRSIKYWENWEAGYKRLREALQSLGDDASRTAIEEIANQSVGHLLNEKEIGILLSDDRNGPRTTEQVIGLLSRRIEYVQSNVTSLQNQLQAAEGTSETCNHSRHDDTVDFPLMEIQEELDEDDNVVSSSVNPAGAVTPQVVEALKKAVMKSPSDSRQAELGQQQEKSASNDNRSDDNSKISSPILKQASSGSPQRRRDLQQSPSTSESDSKGDDRIAGRRRKSVTFADGTKSASPTSTEPKSARDVQAAKAANTARRIKAEVRGSIDALKKVHTAGFINDEVFDRFRQEYVERLQTMPSKLAKQPSPSPQTPTEQEFRSDKKVSSVDEFDPVIPTNESPEDAALRREMIRYNMSEVGAVVAEMNLDDADDQSDPSDSVDSYNDEEHRPGSDEDEDRWGMSTGRLLSSDYIKQMQALEQKLNTKSSIGNGSSTDIKTILQAEKALEIGPDGNPKKASPRTGSTDQGKKAVRFAKALDIQERPPSPKTGERKEPRAVAATPVHTDIVERRTVNAPHSTNMSTSKKVSRFKKSVSAGGQADGAEQHPPALQMQVSNGNQVKTPSLPAFTPPATPKGTPTGPPGHTHTTNVIERPYCGGSKRDNVSEPDEFDAAILQQEVAMYYHGRRNRMIQRQGGFLASEAEAEEEETKGPLVDENGKKISQFKAARLQAWGG